MKLNNPAKRKFDITQEGAKIPAISAFKSLQRSVLSTLLWESNAYENGEDVVSRIKILIPKTTPEHVAALAVAAREEFKLRHVPLLLVREMARHDSHKGLVAETLNRVIQRPDELGEFMAIYQKDGKQPLSSQVKKGLAKAFTKFDEYALQKYNRDTEYKLRDVLFLCHAKPVDEAQEKLWKKLINDELAIPDTWEVEISKNGNNKASWERLLNENKMGALALLRNLRNFKDAGVSEKLIKQSLHSANVERVLPFRFISAAKYYPALEEDLEQVMFKCLNGSEKLSGKTALIIDTSPSMWYHKISAKSEMDRFEAAAALAILIREVCESVKVYAFNRKAYEVPNRRGFALRDALAKTKADYSCGSLAVNLANQDGYDRIICLTDGQWHTVDADGTPIDARFGLTDPLTYKPLSGSQAYMLNVSNNKNGVGYGQNWLNLDGFSEAVVNYIIALEKNKD